MHPSAVSSAVSADSLDIPLIDFSAFLSGDSQTKRSTAQAVLSGFQRAGFIYLRNHGIPKPAVQESFAKSAQFFKRPIAQKDKLAWTSAASNRGYVTQGREKVTDIVDINDVEKLREQEGQDLKESFEIGREGEKDHPNHWPDGFDDEGKEFKEHMLGFFGQCKELHMQVMRAIAVGLGIEETWFDGFTDGGDNTLRLLHYPQVDVEVFKKNKLQVRAGSITLLFQDMAGGLQVQSPNGSFIDATPIEDTIVINAGDLLARWSNDTIKSTKHRVVQPPKPAESDTYPPRYSIAYFCNPNFDRLIDAIPSTYSDEKAKKYQAVNSGEYLVQRLTATY